MTNPSPDLIHLVRMLAGMYVEIDRARYEATALPADEIAEFLICKVPVLQGTGNQIDLQRVSEQVYDPKAAGRAIKAMLNEPAPSPDLIRQVEAESVANDDVLSSLMEAWWHSDTVPKSLEAQAAIVAHIDSIITARVAAAIEQAAQLCDAQASEPECPERAEYCADAIRALAASQAAPAKAEGWQLVPPHATQEMLKAFFAEDYTQNGYIEMLRAAPAIPSTPAKEPTP